MKWFFRIVLGLALTVAIALAALLYFVPVSVPLSGLLANWFPHVFSPPHADLVVVGSRLKVPAGYGLSLFAADVEGARMLRVTDAGDVLVALPDRGEVLLLAKDKDGDGRADGRRTLLTGLDRPNGLDVRAGYLYVAETGRVDRVRFDAAAGTVDGKPEVLIDNLPAGGNHWKKTIRFGPDGLLYLAIGSSCNVCIDEDERRAAILRYTPDGKFVGIYATGLRNSAGFDWRDADGELYATDNGRDLLGDDFPPCELNRIREGGFYGWPFANGDRVPDPDFGKGRDAVIASSIPPVFAFRPHNAPLGIVFLRSAAQPLEYRGAAIVALHGSWNRSVKDGYKVVSLHWDADGSIKAQDFLTGFLEGDDVIGRPAEVAEDAQGNIYVSDDYANAVYRVTPGVVTPGVATPGATTRAVEMPTVAPPVATEKPVLSDEARALGEAQFAALGCPTCHVGQSAPSERAGKVVLAGLSTRYSSESLGAYLRRPRTPMPPVTAAADTVRLLTDYLLATY